jgi:hypothetical protein
MLKGCISNAPQWSSVYFFSENTAVDDAWLYIDCSVTAWVVEHAQILVHWFFCLVLFIYITRFLSHLPCNNLYIENDAYNVLMVEVDSKSILKIAGRAGENVVHCKTSVSKNNWRWFIESEDKYHDRTTKNWIAWCSRWHRLVDDLISKVLSIISFSLQWVDTACHRPPLRLSWAVLHVVPVPASCERLSSSSAYRHSIWACY